MKAQLEANATVNRKNRPKMELNRTAEQWQKCDPKAMAKMSEAAIMYALADARSDVLRMHAEIERLRELERRVAKRCAEAAQSWAPELRELLTHNAELCGRPSGPSERAPG